MKYLTSLLQIPKDELKKLSYCFHYNKPASYKAPYAVWQEQGETSFHSDNAKAERSLECVIDFYTLIENDPKLDEIEQALVNMGAAWSLTSVMFESESNLTHFTWNFSVE